MDNMIRAAVAENTFQFKDNNYTGEFLQDLLVYTASENETYKEGLIHIKTGVQMKYNLPLVQLGKIIQDRVPTPSSDQSGNDTGKYKFTERYLEPQDFMVYFEFNPRDFEKYYKWFQPEGNLVFRTLDPKIQAVMVRLLMENKNEYIDYSIWQSVKGGKTGSGIVTPDGDDYEVMGDEIEAGPMKYFDGAIKRILDNIANRDGDKDPKKCIRAGHGTFASGADVEAALRKIWLKTPTKIRKKASFVFVMDQNSWDLYDQYLTDKTVKYTDNTKMNDYRFKGKRLITINSLPKDTIVAGVFTNGMDSNLWMAVDYASDENVLQIEKLQANSELYFFKMLLKVDVNIVRPGEIIIWTPYKHEDESFSPAPSPTPEELDEETVTVEVYDEVGDTTGRNPSQEGWYKSDGEGGYVLATEQEPAEGTDYFVKSEVTYKYTQVASAELEGKNPKTQGWYEKTGESTYALTNDETVSAGKKYFTREQLS